MLNTMFSSTDKDLILQNPTYVGTSHEATNPLFAAKAMAGPAGEVTVNPMFGGS